MELPQRGVDLLVNVLDASEHIDQLTRDDIRRLLREVAEVLSQILERDAELALRKNDSGPTFRVPVHHPLDAGDVGALARL